MRAGGAAYTYLPASVRRFPTAERLAEMLREAGLTDVRFELMAGSIVGRSGATAKRELLKRSEIARLKALLNRVVLI